MDSRSVADANEEALEGCPGVGVEGGIDDVVELGRRRVGAAYEDELGHVGLDVAPAAGEHAGARGGAGGAKAEEDDVKELVG